jgi:hypothetical protein
MLHRSIRTRLAQLALVTTVLTPLPVLAQTPAPTAKPDAAKAEAAPEEAAIIVTGSRISAAGYTAPTPVTVVGEEIILRDARATIGDTIRELPAVGASASPNNTSGADNIVAGVTGLDTVNLRNLGVTRTLVLFDGQRVVQSNVTGQVDIGTIPTALVQRIDVVTAGASAAWGPMPSPASSTSSSTRNSMASVPASKPATPRRSIVSTIAHKRRSAPVSMTTRAASSSPATGSMRRAMSLPISAAGTAIASSSTIPVTARPMASRG